MISSCQNLTANAYVRVSLLAKPPVSFMKVFVGSAFTLKESLRKVSLWWRRKTWNAVENRFVYVQKLPQAIIVRTEKASGLLSGQQASKSTGLFVVTVIWSSSGFQLGTEFHKKLGRLKCVHLTDLHSKAPSRIINNLLHRKLCNTAVFLLVKFIFSRLRGSKNKTDSKKYPAVFHNIPCNNLYLCGCNITDTRKLFFLRWAVVFCLASPKSC